MSEVMYLPVQDFVNLLLPCLYKSDHHSGEWDFRPTSHVSYIGLFREFGLYITSRRDG